MLFLDGVDLDSSHAKPLRFRPVKAPTRDEHMQLTHTIAHRVGRKLEYHGSLIRDASNSYLTAQAMDSADDDSMHHLLGHSITYRIAVGPQQGRKMFTLQTLPDRGSDDPIARTTGHVAASHCTQASPPKPMSVPS